MYVVHVVRQFYPGVGGLENHVLDLARAQVAAGGREPVFIASETAITPAT